MKQQALLALIVLALLGCKAKSVNEYNAQAPDTVSHKDSVATVIPLAFGEVTGFYGKPDPNQQDSLGFLIIQTPEELAEHFDHLKETPLPNYAINFNVAIMRKKKVSFGYEIEKAEIAEERINVYLRPRPGRVSAGQLFALERRDGYPEIRFMLDGKKVGSLALVVVNY